MGTIRHIVRGALLVIAAGQVAAAEPAAAKPPMDHTARLPNIILFLVDDMGLMDTSAPMLTDEGGKPRRHPLNDWYRTPDMEQLAAIGTRFGNFYAHSGFHLRWQGGKSMPTHLELRVPNRAS